MAPTTMEDNQTETMAPPPYISTVDLFSRPSHCTKKKTNNQNTTHKVKAKPNQLGFFFDKWLTFSFKSVMSSLVSMDEVSSEEALVFINSTFCNPFPAIKPDNQMFWFSLVNLNIKPPISVLKCIPLAPSKPDLLTRVNQPEFVNFNH